MHSLCSRCETLPLHELLQRGYERWKDTAETDVTLAIPWYSSLNELTPSLRSQCALCTLIREGIGSSFQYEVAEKEASGEISPTQWRDTPSDDPLRNIDGYATFPMAMALRLRTSLSNTYDDEIQRTTGKAHALLTVTISSGVSWGLTLQAEFRLAVGHDDPLAPMIRGRTVAEEADGDQAFSVIGSWVNSCVNGDHPHCVEPLQPRPLPTRVIDVNPKTDPQKVCIRDEENKVVGAAPYVALSHCWGKCIPFATTKHNLADRKQEIRIEDMSKVFQEAVLITRRLGIQYLWIDTLCIVQDDPLDWQVEAGRMTAVYMDAVLVIGASNSCADDQGFLRPRERRNAIRFHATLPDGQSSSLHLSLLSPSGERWTSGHDPVLPEPLQARAWCLQERYLSRRILLYGANQLFWECRTLSQAEDGDVAPGNLHNLKRLESTASIERSVFCPRPDGDSHVNYRGWYEMIEVYTRRLITVQSDRLPALSGLANAIAQTSNDAYLTGIWKNGLLEGLLWCATSCEAPLEKPAAYRGPSWSWVSVNGPLKFIVYSFIERCKWKRAIADYEALATLVDCQVEADGPDPYGTVRKGAYLRLNAPLLPVEHIHPADNNPLFSELLLPPLRNPVLDRLVEVKFGNESVYLQAGFDLNSGRQLPQQQLFVLLLARLPDGNTGFSPFMDHRFGLLVRSSTDDEETYERVGIVDSPILERDRSGGIWMVILRVLESILRLLERLSNPARKSTLSYLTPKLFYPEKMLREEPEEEMPADPLPEIKQQSATITLV
ncbi:hypothetical protein BBP40_009505 [Aspergillus hancockii]|nr:hypothetical protein BBP40_009505 [Aspergillus hancockii]